MSTKNAASPSKQIGIDRKRHANFTPPNSKKQKDKNKAVTESEDICAVCDKPILEWSETSDGQEAILCKGRCNA